MKYLKKYIRKWHLTCMQRDEDRGTGLKFNEVVFLVITRFFKQTLSWQFHFRPSHTNGQHTTVRFSFLQYHFTWSLSCSKAENGFWADNLCKRLSMTNLCKATFLIQRSAYLELNLLLPLQYSISWQRVAHCLLYVSLNPPWPSMCYYCLHETFLTNLAQASLVLLKSELIVRSIQNNSSLFFNSCTYARLIFPPGLYRVLGLWLCTACTIIISKCADRSLKGVLTSQREIAKMQ